MVNRISYIVKERSRNKNKSHLISLIIILVFLLFQVNQVNSGANSLFVFIFSLWSFVYCLQSLP